MKKPKRRTPAQVKAEKKRAAKKSFMRKNKGRKRAKNKLAQKQFQIQVEQQIRKMAEEKKRREGEDLDDDWAKNIKIANADNQRK